MAVDKRGRVGRPWRRVREFVLKRDGGLCQIRYPGICTTIATTVDHIRPLAQGGDPLNPGNLRAACRPCNGARPNDSRAVTSRRW